MDMLKVPVGQMLIVVKIKDVELGSLVPLSFDDEAIAKIALKIVEEAKLHASYVD